MSIIAERPSKARANSNAARRFMLRALAVSAFVLAAPLVTRPAAAAAAMLVQPSPGHDLFIIEPTHQLRSRTPHAGLIGTLVQGAETFIGGDETPLIGARRAHDLSVAPPIHRVKWVLLRQQNRDASPRPCAGLHLRNPHDLT